MNWTFFQYFFSYLFKSRSRQRLLMIAVTGLMLSSFSLLVIQGVMSGLQSGLIRRSQNILGKFSIVSSTAMSTDWEELREKLKAIEGSYSLELETELLIRHHNKLTPILVRGIDFKHYTPDFLNEKDVTGIVIGGELATKIRAFSGSEIELITPTSTDFLLTEIPRHYSAPISDFFMSELFEIDSLHGMIRLSFLQNLLKTHNLSNIRFYEGDINEVNELIKGTPFTIEKWEDLNKSLVYALNLETTVMIFLFTSMSFLVAICITAGYMIFYNKVKTDLIGFWILGQSKDQILKMILRFSHWLALGSIVVGVGVGSLVLVFLKYNPIELFPHYFVERSLPVSFSFKQYLLSLIIPYVISVFFTRLSFQFFKKENESFVQLLRSYY